MIRLEIINIDKIDYYLKRGAIVCSPDKFITIKDLYDLGAIPKPEYGVKVLSRDDNYNPQSPIFIEVSRISDRALEIIKKSGGQVILT